VRFEVPEESWELLEEEGEGIEDGKYYQDYLKNLGTESTELKVKLWVDTEKDIIRRIEYKIISTGKSGAMIRRRAQMGQDEDGDEDIGPGTLRVIQTVKID
jgi:hypothetical protein